jgi:aspartyl-tRNA synthetase
MESWQRTIACGLLNTEHVGQSVTLNGWVNTVRDHGDLVFIDLRDRTGMVQLRMDAARSRELVDAAAAVRPEYVLSITGSVQPRMPGMENPKLATGAIEVDVHRFEVLNTCRQPLPFTVSDEEQMSRVNEELRLKYRFIDLRRPRMQEMIRLRHLVIAQMRSYLNERGFTEIETPIITKSTPEGARDYLVPYRLEPGLFYALPQSPQMYKQLLMVGGCERYYQIAKCFRDEAQRADRQPEFTQLDLEMAFVTQDDVLEVTEGVFTTVVEQLSNKRLGSKPFTRLTYDEAMRRYGSDKPDLRFGLELVDLGDALAQSEFSVFQSALASGGQIKGVRYPTGASLSRKEVEQVVDFAKQFGAKGLTTLQIEGEAPFTMRGATAKYLSEPEREAVIQTMGAESGDLLLIMADNKKVTAEVLGRLRVEIGKRLKLADPNVLHFCWITDFPVFEWDEESRCWTYAHNPFSMPYKEHLDWIDSNPEGMRAYCYDAVCNGLEMASGSIRIHKPDIQKAILNKLGYTDERIQAMFGHMLNAFEYGAPPHGGIAPGIDRLIMQMLDTDNIREVIAFPKMGGGYDPMMDAPSSVDPSQLRDLHIKIID